jgi:hypothetical protein
VEPEAYIKKRMLLKQSTTQRVLMTGIYFWKEVGKHQWLKGLNFWKFGQHLIGKSPDELHRVVLLISSFDQMILSCCLNSTYFLVIQHSYGTHPVVVDHVRRESQPSHADCATIFTLETEAS